MSTVDVIIRLVYLGAATCFVIGLHLMNSPGTARRGNRLSALGMAAAVVATLVYLIDSGTVTPAGWIVLAVGIAIGAAAGLYSARTVRMTAMPQLVSLFNAVGGGAAALIGVHDFLQFGGPEGTLSAAAAIAVTLDVLIGTVAFSGSLIASGKLQGWVSGSPVLLPGRGALNAVLIAVIAVAAGLLIAGLIGVPALAVLVLASLLLGVLMVLAIGGADMPVVVSLLNAATGVAVAMAGFVIENTMLIIAGAWWAPPVASSPSSWPTP
nr:NAD(P)(+) transhydrogenase (Re/Si-specific) subunit beta [Allosalinactinospora lopnorensis]